MSESLQTIGQYVKTIGISIAYQVENIGLMWPYHPAKLLILSVLVGIKTQCVEHIGLYIFRKKSS